MSLLAAARDGWTYAKGIGFLEKAAVKEAAKAAGCSEVEARELLDMDPKEFDEQFGPIRELLEGLAGGGDGS